MKEFNWKLFGKKFLIYFVILTIVLIPVNIGINKLGGVRIFSGTENILRDMNYIVNPDSPFYEAFSNSKRVNILVLGVNDGLTDTIMLASYDIKSQKIDIISIPRDTYYYRAGKGAASQKVNAIYSKNGAVGTAEAVSELLLGIPINYYVTVRYDAVEAVVDAMGGVPMDIPFTMKYDDPYDKPPLHIYIEKGQQTLDGKQAVQYLRYRKGYSQGDIGRVGAQQEFVKAAFKQALGADLLNVIKVTLSNVDSDLTLSMALTLGKNALGLESDDLETYLTPGKSGTNNGASYWYVNQQETGEMIEQIYNLVETSEDDAEAVD